MNSRTMHHHTTNSAEHFGLDISLTGVCRASNPLLLLYIDSTRTALSQALQKSTAGNHQNNAFSAQM